MDTVKKVIVTVALLFVLLFVVAIAWFLIEEQPRALTYNESQLANTDCTLEGEPFAIIYDYTCYRAAPDPFSEVYVSCVPIEEEEGFRPKTACFFKSIRDSEIYAELPADLLGDIKLKGVVVVTN